MEMSDEGLSSSENSPSYVSFAEYVGIRYGTSGLRILRFAILDELKEIAGQDREFVNPGEIRDELMLALRMAEDLGACVYDWP